MLESRILPYLNHFRLDKLKPTDIMKFYDMLEKDSQIRRIKHNNSYTTLRPLSQKQFLNIIDQLEQCFIRQFIAIVI